MRWRVCILALASLLPSVAGSDQQEPKRLSPDELKALIEKKVKFFFLDVREPAEIQRLGTMKGYVNIPLSQIEDRLKEIPRDALIVTA